ncbi:DUF397 domain-containing protein [Streptomyces sp. NPDC059627]
MSTADLAWFKSTYSTDQDDDCIEVALSWHKSTYSSAQGDSCIEVAVAPTAIHIRDSKDRARPGLALDPAAWSAFVAHAAG